MGSSPRAELVWAAGTLSRFASDALEHLGQDGFSSPLTNTSTVAPQSLQSYS